MGKIFCILGKSGSGKDTVFKKLVADRRLGLKRIVPYTTRPARDGEEDGVEYHFITEQALEKLRNSGRIIEMRRYQTARGIWYYCTVDDGQFDLNQYSYLTIVTPEGFTGLRRYFGGGTVIPLLLEVEDGLRLFRALRRERNGARHDYAEMCRRFLADEADFSSEKIKECEIRHSFDNADLKACLRLLKETIRMEKADQAKG